MTKTSSQIFIYPTDTVWGIGSTIFDEKAYREIARIKKTTEDKPLSVMFTDLNDLMMSFSFPEEMSEDWLRKFFQLESTLGLPLTMAKILIPSWVHGDSDMISLRYLSDPVLKEMQPPFFTTSLNITGEAPITSYEKAEEFQKLYAPGARLLGNKSHKLSGESSTIVFFKNNEFIFIRKGRKAEAIKNHLALTGFSCR